MGPSMKPCEASEDMCLNRLLATALGTLLALLRGLRRDVCGRECAKDEGMARLVPDIVDADDGAAGLLIECRGWDEECLKVGLVMLALCSGIAGHNGCLCICNAATSRPCPMLHCCLLLPDTLSHGTPFRHCSLATLAQVRMRDKTCMYPLASQVIHAPDWAMRLHRRLEKDLQLQSLAGLTPALGLQSEF